MQTEEEGSMNEFKGHQDLNEVPMQGQSSPAAGVLPMNLSALDNLPEARRRNNYQNPAGPKKPLEFLYDIPIRLVFEVGRVEISIKQLMELKEGSMIDLRHVSVDSIDIRINDKIIGYGEAIGLLQSYGIRFGELELFSRLDDVCGSKKAGQP